MRCQNCELEIAPNMVHAIKSNQCPACGSEIMDAERKEQYQSLRAVLSAHQLTTNPSAEQRLREKIIALLLDHFDFTLKAEVQIDGDLIDLEAPVQVTSGEAAANVTTSAGQSGKPVPRRITRKGEQVQDARIDGVAGDLNELDQARQEIYADVVQEEGVVVVEDDGMEVSIEEAKQFFPGHEAELEDVDTTERNEGNASVVNRGSSRIRRVTNG